MAIDWLSDARKSWPWGDPWPGEWIPTPLSDLPPDWRRTYEKLRALDERYGAAFSVAAGATASATSAEELQARQKYFLGRERGVLTHDFETLSQLPAAERRERGRVLNEFKSSLETIGRERLAALESAAQSADALDVTL